MKTVIFSVAAVALMLISSAANAQCSSCGQAAAAPVTFNQPTAAAPITYAQPMTYAEPATFVQPATYAQPATTGCSSCGTANVQSFAAQPVVANYAAPIQASYVAPSSGCSSCGQVSYVAPATSSCCCQTSSRGGLFRGGRTGGLMGNSLTSRAARGGIFSAIRDN